jgi:tetratricopeptide (TPR) repeat protein
MKLQITLTLIIISMYVNNIYANNSDAIACNQALEKGDIAVALAQAHNVLNSNKNNKDALICQGRALGAQGDLNGALIAFRLAEVQSTDAFDKTIATLLIGNTYKSLKQSEMAINSYQQTISNAKAAKSQAFERLGYNAIGNVYFEGNQLTQALELYMAGSKLAANDNERGESYENIAITHHNMNQHDLALEYQIKAYFMHAAVGTLDQLAHTSIELGRYYMLTKNYVSAENALNKIIKFAKEQGGAYFEAQGSYVLAQVKVAMGDIPSAKALIAHAKSIAKNTNDKALDEEINQETQGLF